MRIALAQIDPTVGDIAGNTRLILTAIDRATEQQAELIAFPELAVIGYPPKDLLLKEHVIAQCARAVQYIAERCGPITAVVGYPCANPSDTGLTLYNAAAVCREGRIVATHVKALLPTYDVFDETRYFEPGPRPAPIEINAAQLGISICEDLWNDPDMHQRQLYHDNPIQQLAEQRADIFINCSASPFTIGKPAFRRELFRRAAQRYGLPLVYVNQVGGNDELIFDGNSCVIDAHGSVIGQAKAFEEDLLVVDVGVGRGEGTKGQRDEGKERKPETRNPKSEMAEVFSALTLGLKDYARKCGFATAVLGLSGGIDSAVVACIAAAALGPENVTGISMPSRYSSSGSKTDAQVLAENLGISFHTVPIESAHAAMESMLAPMFADTQPGIAEENIQARLRGIVVMAHSNKFGALALTTGNKSELATGYCTLYGDMAGGLAVIADLPKMMVYELAEWINTPDCPLTQRAGKLVIPRDTITKPPSAELRPDQTDQDSLPPYDQLDEIVDRYVEREQSADRIIDRTGYDPRTVRRIVALIDRNEYKRKQAAPVLKVTGRAFGFGRRAPIAQRYDPTGKKLDELMKQV